MKKSWGLGLLCFGMIVLPGKEVIGQYIYWVDASFASPTLNRSDLAGGNVTTVPLTAKSLPEGVAVDAVHNMIYFGELAYTNANVNSTLPDLGGIVAINTGGSVIRGIAVDPVAAKVYWTTSNLATGATIEKSDLGGANRQKVYQFAPGSGTNLRGIAVDGTNLYWADYSSGKILSGDVTGVTTPADLVTGLNGPVGVALGNDGNIYWTEANANVIRRRPVIPGAITSLVSGLSTPNYIAVDGASGLMYWTEIGVPRIRRADLNGANVQTLPLIATHPTGIAATSSPLPVQLASFAGTVQSNHVRLEWRTLSEVNNYGYFVQRKHESETVWNELPHSFVPGHGTSSAPHDYAFADSSAAPGGNAYRLRQVDLNGTDHLSASIIANVIAEVQQERPLAFALQQNYPNPFNPSTTIRFSIADPQFIIVKVYDLLGSEVAVLVNEKKEPGNYAVTWNAAGMASGLYFYRLQVFPLNSPLARDSQSGAGEFVATRRMMLLR